MGDLPLEDDDVEGGQEDDESANTSVAARETEEYSSSPRVSSPMTRRLAQSLKDKFEYEIYCH